MRNPFVSSEPMIGRKPRDLSGSGKKPLVRSNPRAESEAVHRKETNASERSHVKGENQPSRANFGKVRLLKQTMAVERSH